LEKPVKTKLKTKAAAVKKVHVDVEEDDEENSEAGKECTCHACTYLMTGKCAKKKKCDMCKTPRPTQKRAGGDDDDSDVSSKRSKRSSLGAVN